MELKEKECLKKMLMERHSEDSRTGCWNWTGTIRSRKYCPYGAIKLNGKTLLVHRLAAMLWLGFDFDSKLWVLHKCDNPLCFRPDHLFIGTRSDNVKDMYKKGRGQTLNPNRRFTVSDIIEMRKRRSKGEKYKDIAEYFKVHRDHVRHICKRRLWKYIL